MRSCWHELDFCTLKCGACASTNATTSVMVRCIQSKLLDGADMRPRFLTVLPARGGFQSHVLLPDNCSVGIVAGLPQPHKALGVASPCLEAVKALHKARPLATQACMTLTQLWDARRAHMAISSAECIFT